MQAPTDIRELFVAITIPETLGRIERRAEPKTSDRGIVVCIGDLHMHVDVQKEIADIIEHLIERYGFELICFEGTLGAPDLNRFGGLRLAPYHQRWRVADRALRSGDLNGPLYLAYTRPHLKAELEGVDDLELFERQTGALRANISTRQPVLRVLALLKEAIVRLCEPAMSPDLLHYVTLTDAYNDAFNKQVLDDVSQDVLEEDHNAPSWVPYLEELITYARLKELDIPYEIEVELKKERVQVNWEEGRGIHAVTERLPPEVRKRYERIVCLVQDAYKLLPAQLQRKILPFSKETIERSKPEIQQQLVRTAHDFNDFLLRQPQEVQEAFRAVIHEEGPPGGDYSVLSDFLKSTWRGLADHLAKAPVDQPVLKLRQIVDRLEIFFRMRMQADDSVVLMHRGVEGIITDLGAAVGVINEFMRDSSLNPTLDDLVEGTRSIWQYSETFYVTARKRSIHMADASAREIITRQLDRAILVTGGFHSRDCIDRFRGKHQLGALMIYPPILRLSSEDLTRRYSDRIQHGDDQEYLYSLDRWEDLFA